MENNKETYKRVIFRLKKEEVLKLFSQDKKLALLEGFGLFSMASSYVDKMPEPILTAFYFMMLENLSEHANKYYITKNEEDLERVSELFAEIYGKQFNYGEELVSSKKCEEVEPFLEAGLKCYFVQEIFDEDFYLLVANYLACLFNQKKYKLLIKECTKIILELENKTGEFIEKTRVMVLSTKGSALIEESRHEEALGALAEAYIMAPSDIDVKLEFAGYYEAVNDYETMALMCKSVLKTDPEDDWALYLLGVSHLLSGNFKEGRARLLKAYKLNPENEGATMNLLYCLCGLGSLQVPANYDEDEYVDELMEGGEAEKIIQREIEIDKTNEMRRKLEEMFKD